VKCIGGLRYAHFVSIGLREWKRLERNSPNKVEALGGKE